MMYLPIRYIVTIDLYSILLKDCLVLYTSGLNLTRLLNIRNILIDNYNMSNN